MIALKFNRSVVKSRNFLPGAVKDDKFCDVI